jgi:hypothetical protein
MTPPARNSEHVTPVHSPGVASRAPKYSCRTGETDPVTANGLNERAAADADVRGMTLTGSRAQGDELALFR